MQILERTELIYQAFIDAKETILNPKSNNCIKIQDLIKIAENLSNNPLHSQNFSEEQAQLKIFIKNIQEIFEEYKITLNAKKNTN